MGIKGSGVALWEGSELWTAFWAAAPDPSPGACAWVSQTRAVFEELKRHLEPGSDKLDKIVVETMVIYPFGKSRPNDVSNLQGLAGAIASGLAFSLGSQTCQVVGLEARTWKGQVPRDVMGARTEAKIKDRGWFDRVRLERASTKNNDTFHATGLGLYVISKGL